MLHQFQNLSVFIKKLPGRLSTLLFVSLLCTSIFLVGTPGAYAKAFDKSVIRPEKVVKGGKLYDLAQVLKIPGARLVSVKKIALIPHKRATSKLAPAAIDYIYVQASINWVFYNGSFLCGYGTSSAWTVPGGSLVDEQGDLYVNGNWKDGTSTTFIGSTAGETGCWNFASNTFWEMYASGSATFIDGAYGYTETSVVAFQP